MLSPSRHRRQRIAIYPVIVNGRPCVRVRPIQRARAAIRRVLQRNVGSQAKRQGSYQQAYNPVVVAGLGGVQPPSLAVRPGVLGPISVNFPGAAAAAGAEAGAAAGAGRSPAVQAALAAMPSVQFQNQWWGPQWYGPQAAVSPIINVQPGRRGQYRAIVTNRPTGQTLWVSGWQPTSDDAWAAGQAWIDANY